MKVGDLVSPRGRESDDENCIAFVLGTTNHTGVFALFELSGSYKGMTHYGTEDDWEVISESR